MAQLVIEIPDDLASAVDALPFPPDGYCRRALEEAVVRNAELRELRAQLLAELDQTPDPERKLYTPDEVAELLRLSVRKVREMIASRELEAIHLGRRTLIPARAVDDLIGS